MPLISTTIPNLVNGVSQQPYSLRLASQAEEQVNGFSSVVSGLSKRPGTQHIKKLPGVAATSFFHTINRDSEERYLVVITNGDLRVFDIEGEEQVVNFPKGKAYLSAVDPQAAFRCVTVADYTFVLNTAVTVQEDTTLTPARSPEALLWIRQGAYAATYRVYLNGGQVAAYTVPDGSTSAHATNVTTDYIAEQLRAQMVNATGFVVNRYGSTIHVYRTDGADFTVRGDDSIGDNGLKILKNSVQRFSDLPARGVDGFITEVVGDQSSSFDNYYVKYQNSVWVETVKGGESNALDEMTMPHALIRKADGTFSFEPLTWATRKVGDLDSNPFPSFVDRKINDIFFHRNRLGFISDENIVFSRAGSYFDFFIKTATAVLDDDPIDVQVSHTKVSILRHAVPFNETLLLFSDQTQFQLGASELLTPSTVSVNQTTEYECSLRAKPVGAGRYIYFAVNKGAYTGIREYYVDGATESEDAQEITGHIPKYVPQGCFKIASSGNEDTLALLTDRAPNEVFVYKYYWSDGEKLQASWSRWRFGKNDRVLNCDFIESTLFMVVQREDGIHLEKITEEPTSAEVEWDFLLRLDSRVDNSTVESITFEGGDPALEGDDKTYVLLPYKLPAEETLQVVTAPGGARKPGVIFSGFTLEDDLSGNTMVVLEGDWSAQPFFMGKRYEFRYTFSTLSIKEEASGGGMQTIGEGRLQIRKMSLIYVKSGYFRVEVTPFRRETYKYIFSGRVVGSAKNLIGRVSLEDGKFVFPVASKNDNVKIEIVNDSPLPCSFLSAEWEGLYTIRSQRL